MTGIGRLDGVHGKRSHGIGKFAAGSHQIALRRVDEKRALSPITVLLSPTLPGPAA
jgi:CRISPR/Cas system CSM-associated protein Csm4 (group 5 of RAMP superfamily)